MALNGKTVFIAGGCGTIGSGITRSCLQNGAKVAVSSRTQERLDKFKKSMDESFHSNIILIQEDISTEAGAKKVLDLLEKEGGVQHLISTIGSYFQGKLTQLSVEQFDKTIDVAKPHFICAKTFLPYLANIDGSSYTFIVGTAAEKCDFPSYSMLVVAQACLYGISEAARAEFRDSKVAVNELRLGLYIQPKLDEKLEKRTIKIRDITLDTIGNDIIGDFVLDVLWARAQGIIRIVKREDIDEKQREFQSTK